MHVLFVAEQLDRPETHLLIALAGRGIRVTAMLSPAEEAGDQLRAHGVTTEPLLLRGRFDRQAIRRIRARIDTGCDIVHCLRNNRPLANTTWAIRGRSPRLVAYRGTMGNLSRFNPVDRLTYLSRRVDRIVCVSGGVERYLGEQMGLPAERLVTIHKGHDPAWYAAEPVCERSALGIPEDAFLVGMVANMRPLKGADLLIDAIDRLDHHPPIHLVLVGEIRDPALQAKIEAYDGDHVIHALGYRPDAAAISGTFNLVAMPSRRREGLPRSVIEAMAQGVPAVVSDVGGLPELVRHGKDGVVFPAGNVAALAQGLATLISDPDFCYECGARARNRIQNEFHIDRTVDKTVTLYESLLAGG